MIIPGVQLSSDAIPVTIDDRVIIRIFSDLTATRSFNYHVRQIDPDGNLIDSEGVEPLPTGSNEAVISLHLTKGYLITISGEIDAANVPLGSIYARFEIHRTQIDEPQKFIRLTSGYLTGRNLLSYPHSEARSELDYHPTNSNIQIADPAAGNGFTFDPTANFLNQINAGAFNFVASGAAASRIIRLQITSNGAIISEVADSTAITAGQTRQMILWRGEGRPANDTVNHYLQLPETHLLFDAEYIFTADNIDVGDQFESINLVVENLIFP